MGSTVAQHRTGGQPRRAHDDLPGDDLPGDDLPGDDLPGDDLPGGGLPLGPDSLTWQLFGDLRMVLIGPRPAVLQNMLPALGQGVEEHSVWFAETVARLRRSVPPIFRTLYGPDGPGNGRQVRDFHRGIRGRMPGGMPYSALNPNTFYWAHACFVDAMVAATQTFIRPLSQEELDRIIAESVTWYSRYGVSEPSPDGAPRTWAQFCDYFGRMEETGLVRHRTAAYGVGFTVKGWPRPARVPGPVWAVSGPLLNAVSSSLTIGGLTPRSRAILRLPWDDRRERRYRRFARAVRALDPVVSRAPRRWRMHPIAASAFAQWGAGTLR